ncbi:helix-turn-helix transcriptional regulator [Streptomyces sp. NPDC057654]|uniref:helix-turn-helix transcriptional regulator n=1 Tax=Streptomyces sp. NPDC057654 TaxID=3346196 RepID=UPI00368C6B13
MTDTPGRLLTLLSLLQTPREWPGSELAERLRVSVRTIRRDIDRLRELGYPVQATLGSVGGYRLVAGAAMPPLVLDDEEAVAIAVGLRTGASHAVEGIEEASVRALAKLEQVLPARLRHRVGTLQAATVALALDGGTAVDPHALTVMAAAAMNHERLRFGYRAGDGAETRRRVEPYRLVCTGHRWYLVAYDSDRADWRTFRVDRLREPHATGARFAPRELPAADAAEFVARALAGTRPGPEAVVTLYESVDALAGRLPESFELMPLDEHSCLLRTRGASLEWQALRLLLLGCDFEAHKPPELIELLRELGGRITRAVGTSDPVEPA